MRYWNYRGDGKWRLQGIGFKRHIASLGNMSGAGQVYGVNLGCLENVTPEELAAAPIIYVDRKHDNRRSAPAITSYL